MRTSGFKSSSREIARDKTRDRSECSNGHRLMEKQGQCVKRCLVISVSGHFQSAREVVVADHLGGKERATGDVGDGQCTILQAMSWFPTRTEFVALGCFDLALGDSSCC